MALTALESNPLLPLKIIPCGLNYFHGHRFRSSAYLDIGEEFFTRNGDPLHGLNSQLSVTTPL